MLAFRSFRNLLENETFSSENALFQAPTPIAPGNTSWEWDLSEPAATAPKQNILQKGVLLLEEDIANGQRIASYLVQIYGAKQGGELKPVVDWAWVDLAEGQTVSYRLQPFELAEAYAVRKVRIAIKSAYVEGGAKMPRLLAAAIYKSSSSGAEAGRREVVWV